MEEPKAKRAIAFFDGQNLYHHAKAAFGHHYPNYDPAKLFNAVCAASGWEPFSVRFYTGTPLASKDALWHGFWSNRLLAMRRSGIFVVNRPLRYRAVKVTLSDGSEETVEVAEEKGIDVRIALDVMRLALNDQFDVAVLFSQDQDFVELGTEIREISRNRNRWIKIVSAYPSSPKATARRGIDKTDWFPIDQALYDGCLDPRDYRPAVSPNS